MIRPIDTQILYPQSPELSNRQQVSKQQAETQQQQFADLVHKQSQEKKEVILEIHKDEKVQNDNQSKKQNHPDQHQKNKQNTSEKETNTKRTVQAEKGCTIDIKI